MITQICKRCKEELPKTIEYFYKYSTTNNKFEPGHTFHTTCKQCEYEILLRENWSNNLLKCHKCGQYLSEENFQTYGKDKENRYWYRNGRDKRCKACKNKQMRNATLKYDSDTALYKLLNVRLLGAKGRSKKCKLDFDLTLDYLLELWKTQNGLCAVSKIPMTYNWSSGRIFTNVSIDQINPHLGYTKENIQLVCMAVNQMKSDMSIEELYMFCEAIIKNKN